MLQVKPSLAAGRAGAPTFPSPLSIRPTPLGVVKGLVPCSRLSHLYSQKVKVSALSGIAGAVPIVSSSEASISGKSAATSIELITWLKRMAAEGSSDRLGSFVDNIRRTGDFWRRATWIYGTYKTTQAKALLWATMGKSQQEIEEQVWIPQHEYAGDAMFDLCVTIRGFYLKVGQFIGSRNDFVPEQICNRLCRLCDRVPPMSSEAATHALRTELGVQSLTDVFDWIDLQKPLGSASIAQVHKAKLRTFSPAELKAARSVRSTAPPLTHRVAAGQGAWDICNLYGASLQQLTQLNKGVDLNSLKEGQVLQVPAALSLDTHGHVDEVSTAVSSASAASITSPAASSTHSQSADVGRSRGSQAVAAVLQAQAFGEAPETGLVAVKIQYPNAMEAMSVDLKNIRAAAYYLSKTEIKFDLVSAVDELNKQIKLEFDFNREARVMDSISYHLRDVSDRIQVPRSVPGLVSKRLLVMSFLEGIPLLEAGSRLKSLSALQQAQGKKRILERISEAYGRMLLGEGLFQADGHPGNILVSQGGRIGLLDYGQSKQLSRHHKLAFAQLVMEMDKGDKAGINRALKELGVVTDQEDHPRRVEMAYGMFDTRGKVDPFDPNSPIKQVAITTFPPDMFFVLRVVQLLRGMANGMGITDFSCAQQWAPLARQALRLAASGKDNGRNGGSKEVLSRVLKVALWPMPQLISRLG